MKTCELCGERTHDGPCYADLLEEWRRQDCERFFSKGNFEVIEFEGEKLAMHKVAYKVMTLK